MTADIFWLSLSHVDPTLPRYGTDPIQDRALTVTQSYLHLEREGAAVFTPLAWTNHVYKRRIASRKLTLNTDAHRNTEKTNLDLHFDGRGAIQVSAVWPHSFRRIRESDVELHRNTNDAEHTQFTHSAEERG